MRPLPYFSAVILLCLPIIGASCAAFVADQHQRIARPQGGGGGGGKRVSRIAAPLRAKKDSGDAISGYKFGDLSRGLANRFTKRVEQVTGKEYEFGDLTKHVDQKAKEEVQKVTGRESYEFGDISRWADARVKQRVCELTGKESYDGGDLSKEIVKRVLAGEVKWEEVIMLLKVLLSLGASFSPVAGMLPAKVLIDLLNYSIAAQVGEKVTGAISTELDRRMKHAVTGDPEYQLGDFTKAKIMRFVGKDESGEYELGDLTKTVLKKMNDSSSTTSDEKNGTRGSNDDLLFGGTNTKDAGDGGLLELNNEQILAELAAWDKAFKVESEGSSTTKTSPGEVKPDSY